MYLKDSKGLYKRYFDATRRPYGYLLSAQDTHDRLRFGTVIFPSEVSVVYAPIDNETDTVTSYKHSNLVARGAGPPNQTGLEEASSHHISDI